MKRGKVRAALTMVISLYVIESRGWSHSGLTYQIRCPRGGPYLTGELAHLISSAEARAELFMGCCQKAICEAR
jgi:hypothetical protein